VEGHDPKIFYQAPDRCPLPLSLRTCTPTFKFVPVPQYAQTVYELFKYRRRIQWRFICHFTAYFTCLKVLTVTCNCVSLKPAVCRALLVLCIITDICVLLVWSQYALWVVGWSYWHLTRPVYWLYPFEDDNANAPSTICKLYFSLSFIYRRTRVLCVEIARSVFLYRVYIVSFLPDTVLYRVTHKSRPLPNYQ